MTKQIIKIQQQEGKIFIFYPETVKVLTIEDFQKRFQASPLLERLKNNWHRAKLDKDFQMIRFDDINIDSYTIEDLAREITFSEYLDLLKAAKPKKQQLIKATLPYLLV